MPDLTSIIIDLGAHALELSANGVLIASHPGDASDPITEAVQLSDEEAYCLYLALHARFTERATADAA